MNTIYYMLFKNVKKMRKKKKTPKNKQGTEAKYLQNSLDL